MWPEDCQNRYCESARPPAAPALGEGNGNVSTFRCVKKTKKKTKNSSFLEVGGNIKHFNSTAPGEPIQLISLHQLSMPDFCIVL